MSFGKTGLILLLSILLASCAPADATQVYFPTYDPFLPLEGAAPPESQIPGVDDAAALPTSTRPPTPTRVPFSLPSQIGAGGQTESTPTPDPARVLPTPRRDTEQYTIQQGDTLGVIAQRYGISLQSLMEANGITNPNLLEVGVTLKIPAPNPSGVGTSLKILPDSELVYGPAAAQFDVSAFIQSQKGYLARYAQDVDGVLMSGEDILLMVAQNYSVNPRILLALLEYQSGWVTNPTPSVVAYPMGYPDPNREGLYRQLTWAANTLNRGYYLWKANAFSVWLLTDRQMILIDPTINAGTAAVQYFFAQLNDLEAWRYHVSERGVVVTYFVFFGNPFQYAIEPLVPPNLAQPPLTLPFEKGVVWYFTGGPHGGWDSGSAWAALDFAPSGDVGGCAVNPAWVTAMTDGLIVRASDGAVVQDLDNDGYEQTGWVLLYMHVAEQNRAQPNEYLFAGERVGHPSCEGGFSTATHLHIARKYNGEWIAADGSLPFNLEGWISRGTTVEYNGFLARGGVTLEALNRADDLNTIVR